MQKAAVNIGIFYKSHAIVYCKEIEKSVNTA